MSTEAPERKPLTPKEARELWAQALEGGKYKQGTGCLTRIVRDEEEDCCLGVACKLAIEHDVIDSYAYLSPNLECYPAVQQWLGLKDYEGGYRSPGGPGGVMTRTALVIDNDSGQTFPEIATIIRAEPEGLVTS